MQITHKGSEGLKHTYNVHIDAGDLNSAMEGELRTLGARVRIPGFRPGFVPMNVLKQRYGKNVRDDVLRNVITEATRKVLEDGKLRPAFQPEVKVEDYKDGESLDFSLIVETIPDVPEIKFSNISLERETFTVPESEIDAAIERLAHENPTAVPLPKTHKAEEGNVVEMDFEGKVNGVPFQGGKAEHFRIELGSRRLIPGFEDQLEGVKAGDEKQVNVTFPQDYFNTELAGKQAVFDVKVHQVLKLEIPTQDDAFAKERGFADLRGLREAARDQIIRHYTQVAHTRLKKRLFDTLDVLCDYPLPPRMVEAEFNMIWGQLQLAKKQAPQDDDVYEGRSEEEVKQEYQTLAERRVRLGILLAEIGNRQKLDATREEMTNAIVEQAKRFPGQEQAVYEYYKKNPGHLDELRGPILEEKAVDWILSQVKLHDKEVSTSVLTGDMSVAEIAKKDVKGAKKKTSSGKKKNSENE